MSTQKLICVKLLAKQSPPPSSIVSIIVIQKNQIITMQCNENMNEYIFIYIYIKYFQIDASAVNHADTNDLYHLCGVFSAVSMFMVNTVSNGHLQGDSLYTDGVCGGVAAKIWFFLGFLIGFG